MAEETQQQKATAVNYENAKGKANLAHNLHVDRSICWSTSAVSQPLWPANQQRLLLPTPLTCCRRSWRPTDQEKELLKGRPSSWWPAVSIDRMICITNRPQMDKQPHTHTRTQTETGTGKETEWLEPVQTFIANCRKDICINLTKPQNSHAGKQINGKVTPHTHADTHTHRPIQMYSIVVCQLQLSVMANKRLGCASTCAWQQLRKT